MPTTEHRSNKDEVSRVPLLFEIVFFVLPIGLGVIVASSWRALRQGRLVKLRPAGVSAVILGLALWIGIIDQEKRMHYWDGWELYPQSERADLVGIYRRANELLVLERNGEFKVNGRTGTWDFRRGESCLYAGGRGWEVLSREGELVLLPDACNGDPDEWNKWAVWSRTDAMQQAQ